MAGSAPPWGSTPVGVRVLGPFEARVDGAWQPVALRQVARVGTALAGWPDQVVERDRLIAAVWGDAPPATAENTLQAHVSHLRRFIGRDLVETRGSGYRLAVAPEMVDAYRMEHAVGAATALRRSGDLPSALDVLDEAIRLWRGQPYQDTLDRELMARRTRLVEVHARAREDVLVCRLDLAADELDYAEVVAPARELVALSPERDVAHHVLVRALAGAGRAREAEAASSAAAALGVVLPDGPGAP
jgi:DNA-binding SARP family transcriptional activator